MNVVLWVVAGLLALVFLGAGAMKLARSKEQLAATGLAWVEDFSPGMVRTIGALEVLGALGLVVPPLLGIAPVLAPLAASGLVAMMIGAVVTHARRGELPAGAVPGTVLGLLALVVAVGRFGPVPF